MNKRCINNRRWSAVCCQTYTRNAVIEPAAREIRNTGVRSGIHWYILRSVMVDIADQSKMLSQGEDDDSEEAETIKTSVSKSFFHDGHDATLWTFAC